MITSFLKGKFMSDKLKILKLEIVNYKRINVVEITPKDNIVEITGKNEAGKSSVIDAINKAISGKKKKEANMPLLRKGQEKGKTLVLLGNNGEPKYEVTRTYTAKGDYLTVQSADGAQFKSPQAFLNSFISDLSFDPLEFANAESVKQREMLLKVVEIPLDEKKLTEISGIKSMDNTFPLDEINGHYKAVYDARAMIGRDVDRLKGALESITIPEGMESIKPISVSELIKEKESLQKQQKANNDCRLELQQLNRQIDQMHNTKITIEKEIEDRQKQLLELNKNIEELAKESGKLMQEVSALKDPDFGEIDQRIEKADELNEIASRITKKTEIEKEYRVTKEKYDDKTERLSAIKSYKSGLLEKTKFPIAGLDFDENGFLTFKGIPISEETTSMSTRIKLGLAIGEALNPKLAVITIKEGNDLDAQSMEMLSAWAQKKDMQVWIERIKEEPDAMSFYIEDGNCVEEKS